MVNDVVLIMRLPKELKARFEEAAKLLGHSVSRWLRDAGLAKLDEIQPAPALPPRDEIDELLEELDDC